MDQKEPRRRKSSTRIATMPVIRVDMMYRDYTTVRIVERRRLAISTHTRVTTRKQVRVKRTRSFRNGNDGVGSPSWNANLQLLQVEKQIN